MDDLSAKEHCADWILEQMTGGRAPEQITADLCGQGWDPEEAEALVEYVRKATRRERGVVTRDDVARSANRRYRQSWAPRWFSGMPTLSSGVRLLSGLRNLFALKKVHDHAREEERDANKS
ncbi:MAG TPA: hypothetical protein VGI81_27335 [Tepidisphaeraceae bacterium]